MIQECQRHDWSVNEPKEHMLPLPCTGYPFAARIQFKTLMLAYRTNHRLSTHLLPTHYRSHHLQKPRLLPPYSEYIPLRKTPTTSTHYYNSTSPPEAPPTSTHYYSTPPPEAPPTSTHYYSTPPPEAPPTSTHYDIYIPSEAPPTSPLTITTLHPSRSPSYFHSLLLYTPLQKPLLLPLTITLHPPPEAPPTSTHYYSTPPPEAPPTSTHYYESTSPPEVWDLLVSDASWYHHREAQNHSPEHSLSPFLAGGMIFPPLSGILDPCQSSSNNWKLISFNSTWLQK